MEDFYAEEAALSERDQYVWMTNPWGGLVRVRPLTSPALTILLQAGYTVEVR
jgi:hypothetical protein